MDSVTSISDLTPEQVDEHMQDQTWSIKLEQLADDLLEDSDKNSLEVAYALISMFVQTSYIGMLFNNLQGDAVNLYSLGQAMREELDGSTQAAKHWDGAIQAIEERAAVMKDQIRNVGAQTNE